VDVLDFEVARRLSVGFQHKVHAARASIADFAAMTRVAAHTRHPPCGERLGDKKIGVRGVDAHQFRPAAEIGFHQFPAMAELAFRIVRFGKPDARARRH